MQHVLWFAECNLFQFHKGTIKATQAQERQGLPPHFNSIKVQLKHRKMQAVELAQADFNSIKVQLKPAHWGSIWKSKVFQFHKGTIKAFAFSLPISLSKSYFNSIKVQLKRKTAGVAGLPCAFQFHKGTIKA